MSVVYPITRKGFNLLNFETKLKTIHNSGEFIDSHMTSVGQLKLFLFYRFTEFQVEVVYDLLDTTIIAINSLKLGSEIAHFEPDKLLE